MSPAYSTCPLVSVADHVSRQCNVDERCELPAVDAYAAGYDAFKRASEEALASSCERLQLACIHLRLSGLLSNHRDCIQCSAIRKQVHAPPPPFSSTRLILVFACRASAPGKPSWLVARPPAPATQSASSQSVPSPGTRASVARTPFPRPPPSARPSHTSFPRSHTIAPPRPPAGTSHRRPAPPDRLQLVLQRLRGPVPPTSCPRHSRRPAGPASRLFLHATGG